VFKALNGKGVSTALATIAIILVLVMSLTWMAYTVVLNARQQAQAAERAESIALKAKELIRVYVWLDPAQQPNGQYLNLTRISFVGSWSGETTINGLLVVYRDGSSRMLGLNIRLGAGEEKTYLPSELGIMGLDNYDAFRRAVKYIQAHTSLGNDFVSLWGRPDKPAIYIVTTTNTGTTTTTTPPPTTTTTTPPPPTVTTTVTVTETQYVYTRCTDVRWNYVTVTHWYTSTAYAGAIATATQWVTSTAWATSTIPTTVTVWTTSTQTQTAWTTVVRWVTVTTVQTTTSWDYTTGTTTSIITIVSRVTNDKRIFGLPGVQDQAPNSDPCVTRFVMSATYNDHVRPSEAIGGLGVSPALLATVTALMAYGSIGQHVGARRILMLLFSIRGVTIILLTFIPLFAAAPIGSVLAQVTSTVTSTRTVTSTVCTATDTVTYTSTVTQYMPTTTTVTTTGTVTVTSTATTTRTSYVTQPYTVTSTYYTISYVTSTVTWTYATTTTSWTTTTRWITILSTSYVVKTTYETNFRCNLSCWDICVVFPGLPRGCCDCSV
jgi:hypothetical protein